jgi:Ca-activated chloride channel family protein
MTIKFRYKKPNEDVSKLMEQEIVKSNVSTLEKSSENFRFSAAVAEFGLLLRDSEFKANASFDETLKLANAAIGKDTEGYRKEFIKLVESCGLMAKK